MSLLIHNLSVTSYSTATAELTLHHNFPKTSEVKAVVDMRLLLEKLNAEKTAIGHWVNVIGYVAVSRTSQGGKPRKLRTGSLTVYVQALMLWSAGPLDIDRYQTCLVDMVKPTASEEKRKKPDTI